MEKLLEKKNRVDNLSVQRASANHVKLMNSISISPLRRNND